MGCPPDGPKPRKEPPTTPVKASVVQEGGYTATPTTPPTVQLADQVNTWVGNWNTTERYISVVGTGTGAEGNPVGFVAIENVPRNPISSSIVTVVEDDAESKTLS